MKLDVFIPCHEKDFINLRACVESVLTYAQDCRTIFVLSKEKPSFSVPALAWMDQAKYPFSIEDVSERLPGNDSTARWYWQQLAKLLVPRQLLVPRLSSDRHLQVDADI